MPSGTATTTTSAQAISTRLELARMLAHKSPERAASTPAVNTLVGGGISTASWGLSWGISQRAASSHSTSSKRIRPIPPYLRSNSSSRVPDASRSSSSLIVSATDRSMPCARLTTAFPIRLHPQPARPRRGARRTSSPHLVGLPLEVPGLHQVTLLRTGLGLGQVVLRVVIRVGNLADFSRPVFRNPRRRDRNLPTQLGEGPIGKARIEITLVDVGEIG